MKPALFLGLSLLVLPPVAEAQLEVGFDSGVTVERQGSSSQTTFEVPATLLRVGYAGQTISFESLLTTYVRRVSVQTQTLIKFLPGIAYNYRRSTYIRGGVGLVVVNAGGSASQFAFGLAVGTKRQIGPGPLYLRLEAAMDQWLENSDFLSHTDFRGTIGLSVVIN
jgi:hypothetical protein